MPRITSIKRRQIHSCLWKEKIFFDARAENTIFGPWHKIAKMINFIINTVAYRDENFLSLVMFLSIDENIFRASSSKVICSFSLVPVYIHEHSSRYLADSLEVLKCLRSKNNYMFRIFEKLCTFSIECKSYSKF